MARDSTAPCKRCREPISTDATACPHCRYSGEKDPWIALALSFVLLAMGVLTFTGVYLLVSAVLGMYGGFRLSSDSHGPVDHSHAGR